MLRNLYRREHPRPRHLLGLYSAIGSFYDVLNGTEAATLAAGTTIGGATLKSTTVAVPAATTTLTLSPTTHGNKIVSIISTGGLAITPPAATGTGDMYRIFVATTVTGGNVTIDAKAGAAADVFYGFAYTYKATDYTNYATAANTNLITWNGTTTGGILGDYLEMIDVSTNCWALVIRGLQSGTIASPFSNH